MSEVLSAGGGETAFRGSFGAGKRVLWCRQSIALVPGLLEGGRAGQFGQRTGLFLCGWVFRLLVSGGFCWLVREIFLVS